MNPPTQQTEGDRKPDYNLIAEQAERKGIELGERNAGADKDRLQRELQQQTESLTEIAQREHERAEGLQRENERLREQLGRRGSVAKTATHVGDKLARPRTPGGEEGTVIT